TQRFHSIYDVVLCDFSIADHPHRDRSLFPSSGKYRLGRNIFILIDSTPLAPSPISKRTLFCRLWIQILFWSKLPYSEKWHPSYYLRVLDEHVHVAPPNLRPSSLPCCSPWPIPPLFRPFGKMP